MRPEEAEHRYGGLGTEMAPIERNCDDVIGSCEIPGPRESTITRFGEPDFGGFADGVVSEAIDFFEGK